MNYNREDFSPQVGDIVRIRQWDDMADRFGRSPSGISCVFGFINEMKPLCGLQFVVGDINELGLDKVRYMLKPTGLYSSDEEARIAREVDRYSISKDMLEPIVPVYRHSEEQVEYEDSDIISDFLAGIPLV